MPKIPPPLEQPVKELDQQLAESEVKALFLVAIEEITNKDLGAMMTKKALATLSRKHNAGTHINSVFTNSGGLVGWSDIDTCSESVKDKSRHNAS